MNLRNMSFRNLNNKDISKVVELYKFSNKNAIEIASQYNISKNTLYKVLRNKGEFTRLENKITTENKKIKKITNIAKSYLAGVIDGEGYVYITFCKSTKNYLCGVYIKNTNKKLLEVFVKYFGGNITFHKRAKPNHKDSYDWVCFGKKAAKLCKYTLPYLTIKRKQAEILLEFSKTLRRELKDNYKLSAEVQIKRKKLIEDIKTLNKRGSFDSYD